MGDGIDGGNRSGTEIVERGFRIRGRVQGVGFRWWTRQTATSLELDGAVKNLRDGSVEVKARGPAEKVERLLAALRRGPSSARVETVDPYDSSLPVREGAFRIVR